MKKKIRLVAYLPRRLYRILEDIAPLFKDYDLSEPKKGAITRALEHILQYYMESEDYRNKLEARGNLARKLFEYMTKEDVKKVAEFIKSIDKD